MHNIFSLRVESLHNALYFCAHTHTLSLSLSLSLPLSISLSLSLSSCLPGYAHIGKGLTINGAHRLMCSGTITVNICIGREEGGGKGEGEREKGEGRGRGRGREGRRVRQSVYSDDS